jgi:hypothetical protein
MKVAFSAALSLILLASCGSEGQSSAENEAVANIADGVENRVSVDPAQPNGASDVAEPAPQPDAVSHPNGYLPPAPGEADPAAANGSGPTASPPATEDEYMRNRQSGR